jgi:hypothetical protein
MQEKRKEPRWPAYLGGRASFLDHQSTADCLIRNTSEQGALLRVERGQFFPDEFELIIPQRDTVFRARARWRGGEQVGVELRRAAAGTYPSAPLSLMERLKRVEKKNRQLKRRLAELSQ